jgi:hypothetical protein
VTAAGRKAVVRNAENCSYLTGELSITVFITAPKGFPSYLQLHGLGPVTCSNSELLSEIINDFHYWYKLLYRRISQRKASTYTEQHDTETQTQTSM